MLSKNKIKFLQSLSAKKNRDEFGLFIAEGEKLISEIAYSKIEIVQLIGTSELIEKFKQIEAEKITSTSNEVKKISSLKSPQDLVAVCRIKKPILAIESLSDKLTLALDDIQDPGNLGTIIRLASWFGIQHIVCSLNTVDCYNPKVVQATMGAIAKVTIHYTNLPQFVENCRDLNLVVYGTFMNGENLFTSQLSENGILVMGNEGNGISEKLEQLITHKLTIPNFASTNNNVESLNVSIATAIICAEFKRRTI